MNILVTLNSGYINPLCTMLKSLTYTNSQNEIDLYIVHSSLTVNDFQKINYVIAGTNVTPHIIRVDKGLFDNAPTCKRISKETYYRLFAPALLPQDIDRILYIDPDTIILNDLSAFYGMDFNANAIIGAKHFDGAVDLWNRKRLSIKKSKSYINAGVMLLNLNEMRKTFDPQGVFDLIEEKKNILFLADQDAINIIYDGKIDTFDETVINLDERCFTRVLRRQGYKGAFNQIEKNTMIIHYDGKQKPWHEFYNGELLGYWEYYNALAPYAKGAEYATA